MTQEEEDFYEAGHDFSILHSSRLDSMCLFLGPARFVNHDCSPNGTFVTQGTSVSIATTRPVKPGEEITVFYSPDYFGPNNADCLCATCQRTGNGGFRTKEQRDADEALLNQAADPESPNSLKRNRLDALEIVTNEMTNESSIKAPRQLATPPDSELSLEDIAKIAYLSSDDEFHSMPEDSEDEQLYNEAGIGSTNQVAVHDGDTAKTANVAVETEEEPPEKKVLRPRRSRHDYNLKRQSAASIYLNDNTDAKTTPKGDGNYCHVCSEEVPEASTIEEIWSNTESVGIKEIKCKRCDRHSKIYGAPWPTRAPVRVAVEGPESRKPLQPLRRPESPNGSIPSRTSAQEKVAKTDPSRLSTSFVAHPSLPNGWSLLIGDRYTYPSMDPAKAQMRRGALLMPRLAASFELSRPKLTDAAGGHHRQNPFASVPGETGPVKGTFDHRPKSSSTVAMAAPADPDQRICLNCKEKKWRCTWLPDDPDRCNPCFYRKVPKCIVDTVANQRSRSMSTDSEVAALQVTPARKTATAKSPIPRASQSRGSVDTRNIFDFPVPDASPVPSASRLPQAVRQLSSEASQAVREQSTTSSKAKREKLKHSWEYVEVSSDEDEKQKTPLVLEGRTRRQATTLGGTTWTPTAAEKEVLNGTRKRRRSSKPIPQQEEAGPSQSNNTPTPIETNSTQERDDESLQSPTSPPISNRRRSRPPRIRPSTAESNDGPSQIGQLIKKSRAKRPKRQLWEYVSVSSGEEDVVPEVVGDRASRRKSAPVYKV